MIPPPNPPEPQVLSLENIVVVSSSSQVEDAAATSETEFFAKSRERVEIDGILQDLGERKKYAGRIFWMVVVWLAAIALVIVMEGFHLLGFYLDSSIVIALIGGTTTGIVGLFLIVARYLFPRRLNE
jgi:hypothetical protein